MFSKPYLDYAAMPLFPLQSDSGTDMLLLSVQQSAPFTCTALDLDAAKQLLGLVGGSLGSIDQSFQEVQVCGRLCAFAEN